jgi:hypothetical protein
MFAKTAKFQVASARQAASRSIRLAYSNDNTLSARSAGGSRPARRPILVCRWRPMIGGGLACYWDIEAADGAATEGPDSFPLRNSPCWPQDEFGDLKNGRRT